MCSASRAASLLLGKSPSYFISANLVTLIAFLGSLIRQWDNNRDITHAMQIRLIKLLLGTDVNLLMDAHGKYPASNFNMIALALRCHSPKQLVNAVIESGVFVVERCNEADLNCYGIRFF